jgi:hypothetical protein
MAYSHNEQPLPPGDPVSTIEREHGSRKQSAESVSKLLGDVQSGQTLS